MCLFRRLITERERCHVQKYERRGWVSVDWLEDERELSCYRRVGDSMCWSLPLLVKGCEYADQSVGLPCLRFAVGENCVVFLRQKPRLMRNIPDYL